MNADAQRIAIAKACGWQKMQRPLSDQDGEIPGYFELRWFHPKVHTSVYPLYALPKEPLNYLADLNAMHEAEKVLTEAQRGPYCGELLAIDGCDPIHAAATQRAEAFLKTLNLWQP